MNLNSIAFDSDERLNADMGRSCPVSHSFSTATGNSAVQTVKATLADVGLATLKTVYVDASQSPAPTSITFGVSRQTITAAPYTQGYYRVVASPLDLDYTIVNYSGATAIVYTVNLLFLNVAIPPQVWNCQSQSGLQGTPWSVVAGTPNSILTLSAPNNAGRVTFVSGLAVSGGGATAASIVNVTLTNLDELGASSAIATFVLGIPALATNAVNPLMVNFNPPIEILPLQTAVLTVPAFGAGNTAEYASLFGILV